MSWGSTSEAILKYSKQIELKTTWYERHCFDMFCYWARAWTRNWSFESSDLSAPPSLSPVSQAGLCELDAFKTQLIGQRWAEQGGVSSSVHCTLTRTGYHCHQPGLPDLSHMSGVNDGQWEGLVGSRQPIRGRGLHILCIPETQTTASNTNTGTPGLGLACTHRQD